MASTRITHGHSQRKHVSSEYRSWDHMIQRCTNAQHDAYKSYGGRGVMVCPRWRTSFEKFLADMGPKPTPKHTIERKNSNLGYSPENCRWATQAEQLRNTSRTHLITFNGITLCLTDWAARIGISKKTLSERLRTGWTVERALSSPIGPRGVKKL